MTRLIITLVIALLVSGPALSDTKEYWPAKVYDLLREKDYVALFDLVRPLAEQNVPLAEWWMGEFYYWGDGVAKNQKTAFAWYKLSAEHGYSTAQWKVGTYYFLGLEFREPYVKKDLVQAYYWFSMAAYQGDDSGFEWLEKVKGSMSHIQLEKAERLVRSELGRLPEKP
jgi:TPR repeat protein